MQKDCPRSRLTVDEAVKLCALLIVLRLLLYSARSCCGAALHTPVVPVASCGACALAVRKSGRGGIGGPEVGRGVSSCERYYRFGFSGMGFYPPLRRPLTP